MHTSTTRFWIGVLIAAAGLTAAALFWNRAFPTAALQFSITEAQAQARSREQATALGYDLKDYFAATWFGEDSNEKNYIEKEFGVRVMEQKVRDGINLWYWTTRLFKPEQEEEFSVSYDPQGRFVSFSRHIKETAAAPRQTREQARAIAEDFLKRYVTHHPFEKLRLVEDSSYERPNRTDYYFTWEQDDLRLGDAPYQIHLTVQGDRIGSFNENVKVPETWRRQYATLRSTNELFGTFAQYATMPIYIGTFVLFILYAVHHKLRWRYPVPKRWLVLFALVSAAAVLNDIPDIASRYQTTQPWNIYVFNQVSSGVLGVLLGTFGMYLLSLVADPLYREKLPDKLPFSRAMGEFSLYRPETVRGLGVGIILACFGLGYVCTFYVVANHFGAWSPVEINYSKIIGGPIPWIGGVQIGLSAAWSEEFLFRVIGVLLYVKLLRFRWVAIVLAGMTWAFLHSTYPQMPGYIRGLELTVEGVLWGVIMVRYGIVATLTGHYLYDCWLGSLVVWQSPDPLNKLGALAVSVWPIALWLIGLRFAREGRQVPEWADANEELPPAAQHHHPPLVEWSYRSLALPPRQRQLCYIVAIAAAVVLWFGKYPPDPARHFGEVTLSRNEIAQRADAILREHGQDPAKYRRIIDLGASSTSDDYLLEQKTPEEVAGLFNTEWPDLTWSVRYFRFMQKEEFNLSLDKHGKLIDWDHDISREAPGASLDKAQALTLAENYLRDTHGIDFSREKLVLDKVSQQEHRRDYSFVWERRDWKWGEATLRTSLNVQGDEPIAFDRYVKIPAEWRREQAKKHQGWKSAILSAVSSWTTPVISVLMGTAFVMLLRRRLYRWRAAAVIAIVPTLFSLVDKLNALPWFYDDYTTTTPIVHYLLQALGNDAMALVILWLKNGLLLSIAFGAVTWAFGWKLEWLRWPKFDWPTLRRSLPHYAAVLLLSLSIVLTFRYFREWVYYFTNETADLSFRYPPINYAVPWLDSVTDALRHGFDTTVSYAIGISVAVLVFRRWPWVVWTFLAIMPVYHALSEDSVREFIISVALGEAQWMLTAYLIWKLWRFDVSTLFLVTILPGLFRDIFLFLEKGGATYRWEAVPLIVFAAGLIVLGWWLRPPLEETPKPAPDFVPDI